MMKTYSNWSMKETSLQGVKKIQIDSFEDFRGSYTEIYNKEFFNEKNIKIEFIQDDISVSKKKCTERTSRRSKNMEVDKLSLW